MISSPRSSVVFFAVALLVLSQAAAAGDVVTTPGDRADAMVTTDSYSDAVVDGDATVAADADARVVAPSGPAQQATDESAGRHRNPAEARDTGSGSTVPDQLFRELAQKLQRSSAPLTSGEYSITRDRLGPEFEETYQTFDEAAGSSGVSRTLADTVGETARTQRELSRTLEAFDASYDAYRAAWDRGDGATARRHARDVERHAENASTQLATLESNYETMAGRTDLSFELARGNVDEVQTYVTDVRERVVDESFVRTTIEADRTSGAPTSFEDPLALSVTLTERDGTPIDGRDVQIAVGGQTYDVRTDADGTATVRYRPTTAALSQDTVNVAFVPKDTSRYLGTETTVPINLRQTTPDVTVNVVNDTVAYGETIAVRGEVTSAEEGVDGVPVVAELDGAVFARGDATDGTVELAGTLPASAAVGSRPVTLRVATADQTIAPASGTDRIDVEATATTLRVAAEPSQIGMAPAVRATGRLSTADEEPIPNQSIAFAIAGEEVATATTDADGRFETVGQVRDGAFGDGATLNASFDGASNLEEASARAAIDASMTPGPNETHGPAAWFQSSVTQWLGIPWTQAGIALFGLFTLVAGLMWFRGRDDRSAVVVDDPGWEDDAVAAEDDSGESPDEDGADATPTRNWFAQARDRLDGGDGDGAVVAAYRGTRDALGEVGVPESATHWEYLDAYAERDGPTEYDVLERLTRLYERAQYSRQGVPDDEADGVVSDVDSAVGGE